MKNTLLILSFSWAFLVLAIPVNAQSQKIPEGISLSFNAGNAAELSKFFDGSVELIILEKEDVYSRSQAEQILRKFFAEHKPEKFDIIFQGGPESSPYAIGSLQTTEIKYRVYILMKKQNESHLINHLRIEEEEENDK